MERLIPRRDAAVRLAPRKLVAPRRSVDVRSTVFVQHNHDLSRSFATKSLMVRGNDLCTLGCQFRLGCCTPGVPAIVTAAVDPRGPPWSVLRGFFGRGLNHLASALDYCV
jgi:hypothetical protein